MTEQAPAWFTMLEEGPEKRAIRNFYKAEGNYSSWGYMAPELKAFYYEEGEQP
ncbi:hypothetical protein SEA_LILYPAD_71 [Gordonia phage LilyPad]|nr:hypothetical protein SEA_LILYPAD_71 [Gordonia phage LilyPad]